MSGAAGGTQGGDLEVTRLELRTIVAADLGWAVETEAADAFLRERGRPEWLRTIAVWFTGPGAGFGAPRVEPPSYGRSNEHGRQTFSEEFSDSYMPLVSRPQSPADYLVGCLTWRLDWLKVGPTGAFSICARAELRGGPADALEVIESYHQFRRDVRDRWQDLVAEFLRYWSSALSSYRLVDDAPRVLLRHTETYDVVDFDFTVDGAVRQPKDLYRSGEVAALRALAGLTRMSHVMDRYSEEKVRALEEMDLGSRPDELWIVNVERLTRHHPEHLSDRGKQLFLEDVVRATEIILHQRVTLKYVTDWVRRTRATFLDRLTAEEDVAGSHSVMRTLLAQIAWSSDLYSETLAVHRDSGSSFFRTIVSRIAELKEVDLSRDAVSGSVTRMLEIASAIFQERSAAASARLQEVSLSVGRASRNIGIAAAILVVASVLLAAAQVWMAVSGHG
ncbi:hypothetical protein GCM10022254_16580 [Actinomadura meridiana]|uniref:Uncharacterized protein n=1 Tax=Actinomadura meridiana TaxID=559626 RepID=A0ABP8BVR6_9ACTN